MKLNEILTVSGQSGLYKYVAQGTRGVIVESLADGRRSTIAGHAHVSSLSEISMFTEGDDMPLVDIFSRLLEQTGGEKSISHKEPTEMIKSRFETLLPEYDRDRVRVSDMKKCFAWFNILVGAGATEFTTGAEESAE